MKKNIIFGLIIGLLIIAISSCSLSGTSMADRIGYFEDALNGSRVNITVNNIHPDAPSYNTLDDTYWATIGVWPTVNQPFSISNLSEGSSSITADFAYSGSPSNTIYFEMEDNGSFFGGEDWLIWSCDINSINQF